MEKPKYLKILFLVAKVSLAICVFFPVYHFVKQINFRNGTGTDSEVTLTMKIKSRQTQTFEVFYNHTEGFTQDKSLKRTVLGKNIFQPIDFLFKGVTGFTVLRFDPGQSEDTLWIKSIEIKNKKRTITWDSDHILKAFTNKNQCQVFKSDSHFALKSTGSDPYIFTGPEQIKLFNTLLNRGHSPLMAFLFGIISSVFVFLSLYFYEGKAGIKKNYALPTIYLTGAFTLLLVSPVLLSKLNISPNEVTSEKRYKAPFPEVSIYALADFPDDFSAWFNDHFGGRDLLIKCYSYIKTQLFHISPLPEKVMLGKDGWLFYADENTPDYYRNANLFSPEQLKKIKYNLEQRAAWCKLHGARYYLLLPPMASSVYPEFLPSTIKKENTISCLEQVLQFLADEKAKVTVIDLLAEYRKEKLKRALYYKTDFHWNFYGAFLAYKKTGNTINQDTLLFNLPQESDFTVIENTAYDADLAGLLNLPNQYPRIKQVMLPKNPNKAKQIPSASYPSQGLFKQEAVIYQNDSIELPVLVMFRDSYANYLMPFLSEHFSKSCYIWSNHFIPDIIEIEKPTIVVQQIVEKFIYDLLLENPVEMQDELKKQMQ